VERTLREANLVSELKKNTNITQVAMVVVRTAPLLGSGKINMLVTSYWFRASEREKL